MTGTEDSAGFIGATEGDPAVGTLLAIAPDVTKKTLGAVVAEINALNVQTQGWAEGRAALLKANRPQARGAQEPQAPPQAQPLAPATAESQAETSPQLLVQPEEVADWEASQESGEEKHQHRRRIVEKTAPVDFNDAKLNEQKEALRQRWEASGHGSQFENLEWKCGRCGWPYVPPPLSDSFHGYCTNDHGCKRSMAKKADMAVRHKAMKQERHGRTQSCPVARRDRVDRTVDKTVFDKTPPWKISGGGYDYSCQSWKCSAGVRRMERWDYSEEVVLSGAPDPEDVQSDVQSVRESDVAPSPGASADSTLARVVEKMAADMANLQKENMRLQKQACRAEDYKGKAQKVQEELCVMTSGKDRYNTKVHEEREKRQEEKEKRRNLEEQAERKQQEFLKLEKAAQTAQDIAKGAIAKAKSLATLGSTAKARSLAVLPSKRADKHDKKADKAQKPKVALEAKAAKRADKPDKRAEKAHKPDKRAHKPRADKVQKPKKAAVEVERQKKKKGPGSLHRSPRKTRKTSTRATPTSRPRPRLSPPRPRSTKATPTSRPLPPHPPPARAARAAMSRRRHRPTRSLREAYLFSRMTTSS